MDKKYYAGIGSRKAPGYALQMARDIAVTLAKRGYILRSGGAAGMDTAFEEGVSSQERGDLCLMDIYLPWQFFRRDSWIDGLHGKRYLTHDQLQWALDVLIHSGVCPDVRKFKDSIQLLFARNVSQILGVPQADGTIHRSEFVVYWAPITTNGDCMGGTRIAVGVAKCFGVPTYNLLLDDDQYRFTHEILPSV